MNEYVDNEARKARLVGKTVTMAHGAGGRQTSIREEISESFPSAVRSMIFPVWEQNHYT